jgi:hypothetical protein
MRGPIDERVQLFALCLLIATLPLLFRGLLTAGIAIGTAGL